MASPTAELRGEAIVAKHWRDDCRLAVLDATPLRPGRGRSEIQANRKGRRVESRQREAEFHEVRGAVITGLWNGSIEVAEARRLVDESRLGEFIRIAASRVETAAACTHFTALGYWPWQVEGVEGPIGSLLLVTFLLPVDYRRI